MGYVAAVAGNLWALVNPWKTAFEWVQGLIGEDGPDEDAAPFDYPEDWDVWPALLLFVAFAWVENVYADASRPFNLGVLVLAYSAITWAGMLAFGKHRWLRHGEVFSVLFGIFARFSPTEARVSDSGGLRLMQLRMRLEASASTATSASSWRTQARGSSTSGRTPSG